MHKEEQLIWQGRFDGEGKAHRRFYQAVNTQQQADFALFGFACDEGVRRNCGRIGARHAPDAIRRQLANFALHQELRICDAGNVACEDGNLEGAQSMLAQRITSSLADNTFPVILGGGHEVAFASFKGLFDYVRMLRPAIKIGIINIDAHFDLRQAEQPSSGTPFLQAAQVLKHSGQDFHYLCLGIAPHSNTAALFDTAATLACRYLPDKAVTLANRDHLLDTLQEFLAPLDHLYLSIDLDVFPASIVPGVSAPAARGVDIAAVEYILEHIARSGKLRLFDIAEYNPLFDIDDRSAKLAAYLAYQLMIELHTTQEKQ